MMDDEMEVVDLSYEPIKHICEDCYDLTWCYRVKIDETMRYVCNDCWIDLGKL